MHLPLSADRRRSALLAGGALALAVLSAPAMAAEIATQQVAEGVFLFQGAGSNVVALANGADMLVIDGGLDANSADLLAAIKAATGGQRIATLVDTHFHPEQVGLNDEAAVDGATILAHEQTQMFLRNAVTSPLYEGAFGPIDAAALPNRADRSTRGELDFGGRTVQYGYLPAAHTNGDLYVYFPDSNVLVAGGAVGSDSWPLIDYWNGGFIGGLLQGYEQLAEVVNPETVVIPAQGKTITGADLLRHRDMYRQLFRDVSWLMNEGMGYNDVVDLNPLREHVAEFGDPSAFLNGAYRSLEMTNVPD